MEWLLLLAGIFGAFVLLMVTGRPLCFVFMIIYLVGSFMVFGGEIGLRQVVYNLVRPLANWMLVALPLFVLLGEVMFQSGVAFHMIDALAK